MISTEWLETVSEHISTSDLMEADSLRKLILKCITRVVHTVLHVIFFEEIQTLLNHGLLLPKLSNCYKNT